MYAMPNTLISMCQSYVHVPSHSVPVSKVVVDEIPFVSMHTGFITY